MEFKRIEEKWQTKWEEAKIFEVTEDKSKEKYYVLEMFPYPSGSGLHMGHALNYTIGDIFARYKRLLGFNVLHPMGYDALGLPAENAAIQEGIHPQEYTTKSIKHYIQQQKGLGLSYDWTRLVNTASPKYYKWDQWIFLKLFEKGLAYQKESAVNWCNKCNTVLANEQVHNGKCWRHEDTSVEIRHLRQWFIKTTHYAEELYDDIATELTNWPDRTRSMQKNWIGKSYGTEISFEINGKVWPIFTTRPDTIFGVTFMVVSAQHKELQTLVTPEQKEEVETFLKRLGSVSEKEMGDMEKEGAFTGSYAINPANGKKIPVWAANFVIADYGSGMVMADAHDQRDLEFAQKYKINLIETIIPKNGTSTNPNISKKAFTEKGILIKSEQFNGLTSEEAIVKITDWLIEKGVGKRVTNFKLRDWGISRQRYWGTPIPIIHCKTCGPVAVPEKDLPIILPKDVTFGKSNPLETNENFINTTCPKCNAPARRETDTMDTFANSSWYFLRYTDPNNENEIFNKNKAKYWGQVDTYIGGAEHACMHLIYARFYTKFLRDLGLINFNEPANKLFHQGMLHGEDGNKMSKSKGNVILPSTVSKKYGIDAARLFLVSVAAPDKNIDWSTTGIESSHKFINKINEFVQNSTFGQSSKKVQSILNRTIKEFTNDIENFRYNLATIKIRELFSSFETEIAKKDFETFLKLLNPICPHVTEEWWEQIGNKPFISTTTWPVADESLIDEKIEAADKLVESVSGDITTVLQLAKLDSAKKITIIISPVWKYNFFTQLKEQLNQTRNPGEIIKHFMSGELKSHGQDIVKIIPGIIKDNSKLPKIVLDQTIEQKSLERVRKKLEKEFNTTILIELAQNSTHQKAKNASPGKPAIIIE